MKPCALCRQHAPLCRSHIIPEWLYGPLYDEKHRLQVLSIASDQRNQYKQKGLNEPLLCESCEQKFSISESYVRDIHVKGVPGLQHEVFPGQTSTGIHVRGMDYKKVKLFELSILWRCGVSTHPFFARVKLGDKHTEKLRLRLLTENPGPAEEYAVLMFGLKVGEVPGSEVFHAISEPRVHRQAGQHIYSMMFGGFLWVFHVGAEGLRQPLSKTALQLDGSRWISVKNALEMEHLWSFADELRRRGRLPA